MCQISFSSFEIDHILVSAKNLYKINSSDISVLYPYPLFNTVVTFTIVTYKWYLRHGNHNFFELCRGIVTKTCYWIHSHCLARITLFTSWDRIFFYIDKHILPFLMLKTKSTDVWFCFMVYNCYCKYKELNFMIFVLFTVN